MGTADGVLLALFRSKLGAEVGRDGAAGRPGHGGMMDLVWELQTSGRSARDVSAATRRVLNSLFPPGLPAAFRALFSGPFPEFSCRMNAFVTALSCQWLMGPSSVNDVELPDGRVLPGHGVRVERCKFLEEAGCAAVCMNTCKLPTEEFFREDMGLDLSMEPATTIFRVSSILASAPTRPPPLSSMPRAALRPAPRSVLSSRTTLLGATRGSNVPT